MLDQPLQQDAVEDVCHRLAYRDRAVSVGLLRDEDRPELEHGHHVGYRLGVGGQLVVRLREVFHSRRSASSP